MAVVTFNGPIGSGGIEVGTKVAHMLKADYVDRLIFVEAAKRMGATVRAVSAKEHEVPRRRDRLARFMQTLLERSAMSGAGGEPYFGPGIEVLLSREYTETAPEPITAALELEDKRFIEVTSAVIKDLSHGGNVVIVGRGSNMILKDTPGVLHVATIAPLQQRIKTIMQREHLSEAEAAQFVDKVERARQAFWRKFFKVQPDDPSLYHMVINLGALKGDTAAEIIAHAAKDLATQS